MLNTMKNAWKIPDLRQRILFTLLMIVIYRFGAVIPVPFIEHSVIEEMFSSNSGGLLDFFDLMSGGAFKNFTIFALNIYPYITASIILQLLAIAFPKLEDIFRREDGRKKQIQYTRYLTVILALIQGIAYAVGLFKGAINPVLGSFTAPMIVLVLTAGTAFMMWMGEEITEKGIGNGISILIMIGILARTPSDIGKIVYGVMSGTINIVAVIIFLIFAIAIIVAVIDVQQAERRIPVQYAKRVVGRKMYGGQSTHIPMRVLMAGVMPVIFASTFLAIPQTLTFFKPEWSAGITKWFSIYGGPASPGLWIYSIINVVLIIFFTYFYTAVQFNPVEYAQNMKENGGFIPGIRPGRPTSDYLSRVLNRITIVGAVALAFIAIVPTLIFSFTSLQLGFGGTSLLIVTGVALETVKQMEAQMLMRHYKGFL